MAPEKQPGQIAYEARFEGCTLGPRGVSDAWCDLPPMTKAIWARVEERVLAALQNRAFQDGARSAETFARRVHAGQTDKSGAPYTGHLGRVAARARARAYAEALGLPRQHAEWCEQVGWLHDTIEDTGTDADDLLDAGFDPAVVQAVGLLTRPAGKPYLECVASIIASGDRLAMIVKLSDNEDNLDPARALPNAWPALVARYQRLAEILRAALQPEGERNA
ncbi:hypothetical protein E4V01_21955 [Methylorubrum sp. Q1]|uniref:hypothetical protein n=1 Tax=Methylorubrum sp. Q1 TaxID=2562453 RepID=UPI001076B1FE|nr:hypothetical protein [Methylorubrum sp. Q1]TFZ55589.1 hypothetical protein E4V01_21955 [Methylorubrum sp. Q1]